MTARAALLKKAKRYLASARLLLDAGDYDSAVSRVYYAAFHVAGALLDALGLAFSSHKASSLRTVESSPARIVWIGVSIDC